MRVFKFFDCMSHRKMYYDVANDIESRMKQRGHVHLSVRLRLLHQTLELRVLALQTVQSHL
jgi:hypothetical protein